MVNATVVEDDFATELARKVWITKGVRFGAHRRLVRACEWSNRTVALLSVYLVFASLAIGNPAIGLSPRGKEIGALIVAVLSVFVLVLSQLETSRNYLVRADRLHRCALSLGALEDQVSLARLLSDVDGRQNSLTELSQQYASILAECAENHDEIDNKWFRAERPSDFGIHPFLAGVYLRWYWLKIYGTFLLLIALPPFALLYLVTLPSGKP